MQQRRLRRSPWLSDAHDGFKRFAIFVQERFGCSALDSLHLRASMHISHCTACDSECFSCDCTLWINHLSLKALFDGLAGHVLRLCGTFVGQSDGRTCLLIRGYVSLYVTPRITVTRFAVESQHVSAHVSDCRTCRLITSIVLRLKDTCGHRVYHLMPGHEVLRSLDMASTSNHVFG